MNIRSFFGRRAAKMPDDVRQAFLKILYHTLLEIRHAKRTELSFVLSDHVHNIPDLIDRYTPDVFCYYWKYERPCFIEAMQRIGEPVRFIQEYWAILEKHYESLDCRRSAAYVYGGGFNK